MVEIIRPRQGNIVLVGIGIEPEEPFVMNNTTQQLTARAKPRKAQKGSITWRTGGYGYVTVSASGLVTGKKTNECIEPVYADSDAGFSAYVNVRCGKNVTAISLPSSSVSINGIQGIEYALSVTPSDVTLISFAISSSNEEIAKYEYANATYGNKKRLWGLGVGNAVVTVYGRSGNASFDCNVTVLPVTTTGLEIRGNSNEISTDQGDYIPPLLTRRIMFVDQADTYVDVFFLPFNATERELQITNSDNAVADVYEELPQSDYRNLERGTLRKKRLIVHSKAVGTTTITVRGANSTTASFTVDVRESRSFQYTCGVNLVPSTNGANVIVTNGSSGVNMTEFNGWKYAVDATNAIKTGDGSGETSTNPSTSSTTGYEKAIASNTATLSGAYVYYTNKEGNRVTISNVSGSVSW